MSTVAMLREVIRVTLQVTWSPIDGTIVTCLLYATEARDEPSASRLT
eukprot:CAMPEP_0195634834 /NCGR_PEP_ID=MMETSP0815-20121206/22927_1 /TAXON_ID=97485 /ORGANISM="Prymnesium parvum, Strain Texoma1" /LENGTH=46 /DNA_ID= /DNA_START= /DNA_END= /DNA_ORIENTATION=